LSGPQPTSGRHRWFFSSRTTLAALADAAVLRSNVPSAWLYYKAPVAHNFAALAASPLRLDPMHSFLIHRLPLSLVLVCLAVPALATPGVRAARADALHIPLRRRSVPGRSADKWAEWAQREKAKLESKYGAPPSATQKRSSGYNLYVICRPLLDFSLTAISVW